MRYLSHLAVGLVGAVVASAAIWLFQAWNITRYESELAAAYRAMGTHSPEDFDPGPLARLVDPRIRAAERVKFYCLLAGALAAGGCLFCLALRRSVAFLVVVSGGRAQAASGRVAQPFVDEIEACCRDAGIGQAEVWGKAVAGRISLGFSASVPPGVRQRLRNVWVQSGGHRFK